MDKKEKSMGESKEERYNIKETIEEIKRIIQKNKIKEVILQYPEGLTHKIQNITNEIEKIGTQVILHGDPTYGACDIPIWQAKLLGIKHIIHIGHSKYYEVPHKYLKVYYLPLRKKIRREEIKDGIGEIKYIIEKNNIRRINIVSTIQYTHILPIIKEELQKTFKKSNLNIEVNINKSPLQQEAGQITGCDASAIYFSITNITNSTNKESKTHQEEHQEKEKVYKEPVKRMEEKTLEKENIKTKYDKTAILYVGEGEFHPIAILKTLAYPIKDEYTPSKDIKEPLILLWRLDISNS